MALKRHSLFCSDSNSDAEARCREWYRVRYHRPQDDRTQPVDFSAAAQFDTFFYALVEDIANTPRRPAIYATGDFAARN